MDNLISKLTPARQSSPDELMGIRFSLLDKNFNIASDSFISNKRDSYTVKANLFTRFAVNNKEYLLVGQLFSRRKNGLLLVNGGEDKKLIYHYVRVNEKFHYLLEKSRVIASQGLIMPYLHRREAGLLKITVYPEVPASGISSTLY